MGKQQLRFAICDDNAADRDYIIALVSDYLHQNGYMAGLDSYESGEALLARDELKYDLIFMDIFMGGENGIQIAHRLLDRGCDTPIIFCSTSGEFAADSYDVAALRYLIKPVREEKLFLTLDRFFRAHTALHTITYKKNRMDEHVYVEDILWIEAGDHISIIHTRSGDISTRTTIAQLVDQLKGVDYVRPIRYAVVLLKSVVTLPTDNLTLSDGTVIPISRDQRSGVKQAFTDYKMKQLLRKGSI